VLGPPRRVARSRPRPRHLPPDEEWTEAFRTQATDAGVPERRPTDAGGCPTQGTDAGGPTLAPMPAGVPERWNHGVTPGHSGVPLLPTDFNRASEPHPGGPHWTVPPAPYLHRVTATMPERTASIIIDRSGVTSPNCRIDERGSDFGNRMALTLPEARRGPEIANEPCHHQRGQLRKSRRCRAANRHRCSRPRQRQSPSWKFTSVHLHPAPARHPVTLTTSGSTECRS